MTKCLECKGKVQGRSDKKFCSDQCRTTFNNRIYKEKNAFIRSIDAILRKNRMIMQELSPDGKSKANREQFFEKGFKFNYFTNTYTTKQGKIYHFCYEYGYLDLGNDVFAIVIRKEYID